jgi:hypothetical protein
MKGRMGGVFAFFLLTLTLLGEAYGQQPSAPQELKPYWANFKNYLVLKTGVFYPEGDLKNLNAGFNGELAYGFRFSRHGALEIGSGYFETSNTSRASIGGSGLSLRGYMHAVPLTIAIKPIIPLNRRFEVYALGGGGAYYIHSSGTFLAASGRVSGSEDTVVGGGFLGAGGTYNLPQNFFISLEGKYLWTSNANVKGNIARTPFNTDVKIEGIQGTLSIGARF